MNVRSILACLLLLVPLASLAGAGTAPEYDPGEDHAWVPTTGDTLEWAVAGCPETRGDIVDGMLGLEAELDRHGVLPRFERRIGIEPDAQALHGFTHPNAYSLLVQDITSRAGADVVIGCVPAHVFQNISEVRGLGDAIGVTFYAYTWDPGTDLHLFTAAVVVLPEGQRLEVEGCQDPQPIGHALRRVSVMREALHAAGLGGDYARDGVFTNHQQAENRSCSAWWVPASETLDAETVDRLRETWGERPGPGLFGSIASSMQAHTGWWIATPLVLALVPIGYVGTVRFRRARALRSVRPDSGIRRLDGSLGKRPSTTSGIHTFRRGDEDGPAEMDDEAW